MAAHRVLVVAGAFGIDTNVYPAGEQLGSEMTFAHTTDGLGQAGCYSALAATALGVLVFLFGLLEYLGRRFGPLSIRIDTT